MNIILITTLPNSLYNELKKADYLSIDLLDFNDSPMNKTQFLTELGYKIESKEYQLLITYRCPYIIPSYIRDKVGECINIHPVSLPEFRGLNPWKNFMKSGKKASEAIVHLMVDSPDDGKIIARWPYYFDSAKNARETSDRIISQKLLTFLNPTSSDYWFNKK